MPLWRNLVRTSSNVITELELRQSVLMVKNSAQQSTSAFQRITQTVQSRKRRVRSTSNADTTRVAVPLTSNPIAALNSRNAQIKWLGTWNVPITVIGTTNARPAIGQRTLIVVRLINKSVPFQIDVRQLINNCRNANFKAWKENKIVLTINLIFFCVEWNR